MAAPSPPVAGLGVHGICYFSSSGPGVGRHIGIPALDMYMSCDYSGAHFQVETYSNLYRGSSRVDPPCDVVELGDTALRRLQQLADAKRAVQVATAAYARECAAFLDDADVGVLARWLRPETAARELAHMESCLPSLAVSLATWAAGVPFTVARTDTSSVTVALATPNTLQYPHDCDVAPFYMSSGRSGAAGGIEKLCLQLSDGTPQYIREDSAFLRDTTAFADTCEQIEESGLTPSDVPIPDACFLHVARKDDAAITATNARARWLAQHRAACTSTPPSIT